MTIWDFEIGVEFDLDVRVGDGTGVDEGGCVEVGDNVVVVIEDEIGEAIEFVAGIVGLGKGEMLEIGKVWSCGRMVVLISGMTIFSGA